MKNAIEINKTTVKPRTVVMNIIRAPLYLNDLLITLKQLYNRFLVKSKDNL